MSTKVQVLLLQNVKGLGNKWLVVSVASAYANNVLIRSGQAKLADSWIQNEYKQKEEKKVRDEQRQIENFTAILDQIANQGGLSFYKQTTAMWKLYDSIHVKDVVKEILTKFKMKFPENSFQMKDPIESLWEYSVKFEFKDIKKTLLIKVLHK